MNAPVTLNHAQMIADVREDLGPDATNPAIIDEACQRIVQYRVVFRTAKAFREWFDEQWALFDQVLSAAAPVVADGEPATAGPDGVDGNGSPVAGDESQVDTTALFNTPQVYTRDCDAPFCAERFETTDPAQLHCDRCVTAFDAVGEPIPPGVAAVVTESARTKRMSNTVAALLWALKAEMESKGLDSTHDADLVSYFQSQLH
jgi:hypothetical protein